MIRGFIPDACARCVDKKWRGYVGRFQWIEGLRVGSLVESVRMIRRQRGRGMASLQSTSVVVERLTRRGCQPVLRQSHVTGLSNQWESGARPWLDHTSI